MADITVHINSLPYTLSCDDGEEDRLRDLADFVNNRLSKIKGAIGGTPVGENRLLVLTNLMIADELADAYIHVDTMQERQEAGLAPESASQLIGKMEDLAQKLEAIAGTLENP